MLLKYAEGKLGEEWGLVRDNASVLTDLVIEAAALKAIEARLARLVADASKDLAPAMGQHALDGFEVGSLGGGCNLWHCLELIDEEEKDKEEVITVPP